MIGLVGRKVGMTRIFNEDGVSVPVTVIEIEANRVTQVKTLENDGYTAVQVTTGSKKANRVTKPEAGHIGLETLKQAKTQLNVPICAIGGLTVENSKEVIEAGADLCAVISDILGLPMNAIPDRLNAWTDLFEQTATL